jgi:hypothetical protein
MPRNNFKSAADPVIVAVSAQIGIIALMFAALFALKLGWLALRVVSWSVGIHL